MFMTSMETSHEERRERGFAMGRWKNGAGILLCIWLVPAVEALGQSQDYKQLLSDGRREFRAGRFSEAHRLLQIALTLAERDKDTSMMGTIQNDLGDVYISEERLLE